MNLKCIMPSDRVQTYILCDSICMSFSYRQTIVTENKQISGCQGWGVWEGYEYKGITWGSIMG